MKKENNFPLFLAPMDALTHQAFRMIIGRFGGCDEYFNEMINASSLLNNGPWEKYYLLDGPESEKLVWQLTDKNADKMAEAAGLLAQKDGKGIDLNMGCSAPQIVKTGAGIAWMLKPVEETALMVRKVKSAIENAAKDGAEAKRLSVKLRLGNEEYTHERLSGFCRMLKEEGVQMITLHPRTQRQKHSRHCDWSAVEELALKIPEIPVILNGDVKDRASFEAAVKTAPHAQGIMIGTAAAQKPWVFREIRGGEPLEIDCRQLALDFIGYVREYQPEEFYKTRLQRFFAYYCMNFSFGHYFQSQMLNITDIEDAEKRVKEYFEKCPEDIFKKKN